MGGGGILSLEPPEDSGISMGGRVGSGFFVAAGSSRRSRMDPVEFPPATGGAGIVAELEVLGAVGGGSGIPPVTDPSGATGR